MRYVNCPSLLMAPINHLLFIWAVLSSGLTLSVSLSFSLQWATFKPSCPVILINSVYLRTVIKENGPHNFSRQVLELRGWPRSSFSLRLLAFSKFQQRNNNKNSHISCGSFYTLPFTLQHKLVSTLCREIRKQNLHFKRNYTEAKMI